MNPLGDTYRPEQRNLWLISLRKTLHLFSNTKRLLALKTVPSTQPKKLSRKSHKLWNTKSLKEKNKTYAFLQYNPGWYNRLHMRKKKQNCAQLSTSWNLMYIKNNVKWASKGILHTALDRQLTARHQVTISSQRVESIMRTTSDYKDIIKRLQESESSATEQLEEARKEVGTTRSLLLCCYWLAQLSRT